MIMGASSPDELYVIDPDGEVIHAGDRVRFDADALPSWPEGGYGTVVQFGMHCPTQYLDPNRRVIAWVRVTVGSTPKPMADVELHKVLPPVVQLDPRVDPDVVVGFPDVVMVGDVVGVLDNGPSDLQGRAGEVTMTAYSNALHTIDEVRPPDAIYVVCDLAHEGWCRPDQLELVYPGGDTAAPTLFDQERA